jgi:hypothetical protein
MSMGLKKELSADSSEGYHERQRADRWLYAFIYAVGLLVVLLAPIPIVDAHGAAEGSTCLLVAIAHDFVSAPKAFLALMGALVVLLVGLLVPVLILRLFFMDTRLESGRLTISAGFGFLIPVRRVSVSEIASAEVVSYSGFTDWRRWVRLIPNRHDRRIWMGGNQAVQMILHNGDKLLISSTTPQRLVDEIQKQMQ